MLFVMFNFNICLLGRTDMGPFWLPTCTAMGRISMACGGRLWSVQPRIPGMGEKQIRAAIRSMSMR